MMCFSFGRADQINLLIFREVTGKVPQQVPTVPEYGTKEEKKRPSSLPTHDGNAESVRLIMCGHEA